MSNLEGTALAVAGGQPAISPPLPAGGHGRALLGDEEEANVLEVVRARRYHRSEYRYQESFAGRLEMELEKYLDVKHVLLTVSGSMAGKACFVAAEIGPGDEVIVPAISWQTVPGAIAEAGALPIVAQCDATLTMDPADVERLVTPRTRAIVPTHVHGHPCDMDALLAIAAKHRLQVIEDVCQSAGGSYKGRRLGSLGDSGFFSMNCMKLMAAGSAGFIATNRDDVYVRAAAYLGHMSYPPHKARLRAKSVYIPSTVAPVAELTAAVAYAQFKKLEHQLGRMRAVRDAIAEGTAGCRLFQPAPSNDRAGECGVSFAMYFADPDMTNRFMTALRAEGVPMAVSAQYYQFHGPAEFAHWVIDGPPLLPARAAWANAWPFFSKKQPIHPKNDPWQGREVDYSHIIDPSLATFGHIGMIRINPMLTAEHGALVAGAIRKVDSALSR